MSKIARNSFGEDYNCKYDWDEDCFVQCGDEGLVLGKKENYFTAFFEAFPKDPQTFIRGEGASIEEAEKQAWEQLQRFKKCTNHEFERRGYTNGVGFCKHCGLFKSKAFEPTTLCKVCNKPTCHTTDINDNYYCEEHKDLIPDELLSKWQLRERIYYKRTHLKTYDEILSAEIEPTIKELMLKLFLEEGLDNILDKGFYAYSESRIKMGSFIRKNKYVSYKKYEFEGKTYYSLLLNELDKEKNPTGKFIKLFSPIEDYLLSVVKYYKEKAI